MSDLEIITNAERLRTLKPEWDALWLRCRNGGVFQSFDCCLHMWEAIAAPAGRKLFCLVGWDGPRMILVWPFTTYRKLAWKFVRPLAATGAEFTAILIDETLDQQGWIRAAWQLLSTESKSDVVILPYVRMGTDLSRMLFFCLQNATVDHDVAVYAHLKREEDWQSYYDSLSSTHRKKYANLRRRLSELGAVQFEILEAGDPRCPELVRWMLSQKRIWSERTNKKGHWLFSEGYREFLTLLLADSGAIPKRLIMSLTVDGIPIAVKIAAIGKDTLELLIGGFDPRYQKYSPGMRLDEYWVKWAVEHKLNCDFGNGGEHYKRFWSRDNVIQTRTHWIANSWWGLVALHLRSRLKDGRRWYIAVRIRHAEIARLLNIGRTSVRRILEAKR